jgi:bacteriophage HK97-gp10 putative tail-component
MADNVTIEVDTAALFAALDQIPDAVLRHAKLGCKVTADNVATEAQARIRRKSGQTGDAITVQETHDGTGYVVYVGGTRGYIGRFLEFSTKHQTTAYPFLFPSARLEEGAHDRRLREAVQDAIDETGLGN